MGLWWETSEAPPVHLDPRIRDWVLMPIFLVMFMQGVLRHYATMCLKDEVKVLMGPLEENQLVRRSQRLRMNNQFIPPAAVRMRKAFFMQKAFKEKPKDAVVEAPPPQDPMAMMGMMKTNMFTMMLPNMVMMGWVSFFFSGFVLVRLPFPLTDRFKDMLQRGINLKSLNPSYVSSISWYFINLFGLRGIFSLILGPGSATDDTAMMQQQVQGGANAMQKQDFTKVSAGERNELEMMIHDWSYVQDAEYRLLGRTPPTRSK
jgi:hypothetical protein